MVGISLIPLIPLGRQSLNVAAFAQCWRTIVVRSYNLKSFWVMWLHAFMGFIQDF